MIINSKNCKAISICALFILVISILGGAMVFAQDNVDSREFELVVKELSNKTHNQFGDIKVVKCVNLGDRKLVEAEDSKYIYKAAINTGNVATLVSKDYENLVKVKNNLSKIQIGQYAETYLSQYIYNLDNTTYVLQKKVYKDTDNEKIHQFIYEEVAQNGVKTGTGIAIEINNDGVLVLLAVHEGNVKIAMTSSPSLSQSDAIKVAEIFIKNQELFKDIHKYKVSMIELSVWNDKLVWVVKIDDIHVGKTTYGFDFRIDAQTGEILFNDNYCAIN